MSTLSDPVLGEFTNVQVVNGGEGDPFVGNQPATSAPPAAPVQPAEPAGAPPSTPVVPETPAAPAPAAQAPATPALFDETKVNEIAAKAVKDALAAQSSTYDKQINQLQRTAAAEAERAQAAENARIEHERQFKLGDPNLTPEERTRLQNEFANEDRARELDSWQQELEDYHENLLVLSLGTEFGPYGVSEDQLRGFDTPEEMEAFCLDAKATYLEQRAATLANTPAAAAAPAAQPAQPAPAGASALTDVGSQGAPQQGPQFSEERGGNSLAENIGKAKWETVPLNRPPSLPNF